MLSGPLREMRESSKEKVATPAASAAMLPRSPTCRLRSCGAPCVRSKGLKCGPADAQPLLRSPEALQIGHG